MAPYWTEPGTDGAVRAWCGVVGFRLMVAEDQNEASRKVGLPVIPSPLRDGMRRCGSSRTGSIKRATTPLGVGVMTPAITRPAGF